MSLDKRFDVNSIADLENFKSEDETTNISNADETTNINKAIADFGIKIARQMDFEIFDKVNNNRGKFGYSIYIDGHQFIKDVEDLRKYRALEEKLGCPIEAVFKALTDGWYIAPNIIVTGRLTLIAGLENGALVRGNEYYSLKDFGVTWWLDEHQ